MIPAAWTRRGRAVDLRAWISAAAVVVVLVILLAGLLRSTCARPLAAGRALWDGAFGSWYAFNSGTLIRATPLIFTGLAVAIAFQAGVFNVGAEGQLLIGAAASAAIGVVWATRLGPASVVVELFAGTAAGAGWALIASVLRTRFRVLEVISTIMLNFVALYAVGYLVHGPLQEHLHIYPQSEALPAVAQLPRLLAGSRLHVGFPMAVAASVLAWWFMRYTAIGFRFRVVGANANAARIAGDIDVERVTTHAFLISGAFAGLAGAIELSGVTFALYEDLSPGYGYTAIAVALLARLDPIAVIGTGIAFGALESGAAAMQRDAGIPSVVVSIIEAGVILSLVTIGVARIGWTTIVVPETPT